MMDMIPKINVPDNINGKKVIGIENSAFYNGPGRIATKINLPVLLLLETRYFIDLYI